MTTMTATMNAKVLILNRSYAPVAVAGIERAFGLLVTGAAKALDANYQTFDFESWSDLAAEYGDDVVRTAQRAIKVPRVLVLQGFDKLPRTKIRFSRQNIYSRDDFTCQYCGEQLARSKLNLDHVLPRSQGGRTSWENVVCSCIECNEYKGGRTPEQAGMKLKRIPRKPTWQSVSPKSKSAPYKEWLPFIDPVDASYWNTELLDDEE
jgi:5-methylcytosine-specific restriction endonuclease McrA